MNKQATVFCFTDIHNQQAMLDMPTTLRASAVRAAHDAVAEFGQADLSLCGGDNISDYPYWDRSCWLPEENFRAIKKKLTDCLGATAKGGRVLYVAGNNDMILGDLVRGEGRPYNTTEFYYTGPMKDTLGQLPPSECYTVRSEKKPWEHPYLDAFHYVVNGLDFIGINVDPNTAYNSHEGYYTDATLDWVKRKLDEIDPDGYRPVFVVGHLSAVCYCDGELRESMTNGDRERFYRAFDGHRNLFYLYGHIHGEGYVYRDFSSGAVLHLDADHRPLGPNTAATDSAGLDYAYSLVHMGGLRPFHPDHFEDDALSGLGGGDAVTRFPATGTPKLAQYMVMEVYADRVVFHIRNTGSLPGYTPADRPAPYTVYLRRPQK